MHIYFHIYQYIIKNLEQCVAKVSRFLICNTLLESSSSVAVTKQCEADSGSKKKTEYRELRGEATDLGSKQCFLYSSQLFQTPKSSEDTHQMLQFLLSHSQNKPRDF